MNISATEAREALRDIDDSAEHSRALKGYRLAAPYFFIWGAIWMVAYGVTGLIPRGGLIWLPAMAVGIALSFYVGWRNRHLQAAACGTNMWASFLVFGIFIGGTYAILPPHSVNQMDAFPALVTGLAYTLAGVWMRRFRMVVAGVVVAAATMGGFFLLAPWLSFWLAAVGGGGLILAGVWLRSA